jgi:hypothetical protein
LYTVYIDIYVYMCVCIVHCIYIYVCIYVYIVYVLYIVYVFIYNVTQQILFEKKGQEGEKECKYNGEGELVHSTLYASMELSQ